MSQSSGHSAGCPFQCPSRQGSYLTTPTRYRAHPRRSSRNAGERRCGHWTADRSPHTMTINRPGPPSSSLLPYLTHDKPLQGCNIAPAAHTTGLPLIPPPIMTDAALPTPASSPLRCVEALQLRELQFVESLAAHWQSTIQRSPDSTAVRLLSSQLVPVLVPALAELGRRMEQEAGMQEAHETLRRANPLVLPRSVAST